MHINLGKGKVAKLLLCVIFLGGFAHGANAPRLKSNVFSHEKGGEVSLPVRIVPILVKAPPRHVELVTARPDFTDTNSGTHGARLPLTGLPVDLYEFPLLQIKADQEAGLYGVELELDTRDKGIVDTMVRIGSPSLFPEMLIERIDFSSEQFSEKGWGYKIKQMLGLPGDKKWHLTGEDSKIYGIASGIVSASFESSGALIVQRTFASANLLKTPLLQYEYELPEGLPWVVQINAKIARGGINPKLTTLFSEPVTGGGKQKILVNLLDLLQKTDPDIKDGQLEELIIHFRLNGTMETAKQDVRIDLGKLELFHARQNRTNSPDVLLVAMEDLSTDINLVGILDRQLNPKGKLTVLSGKLVNIGLDLARGAERVSKIRLSTEYREKIPELFVGESFLLDELSGAELDAVLDQKTFYRRRLLWESRQSEVIFRNIADPMLPLMSFSPSIRLDNDVYIRSDFSFEDGKHYPLRLTLFGLDVQGKSTTQDYKLLHNKPIKIKNISRFNNATLSFWHGNEAKIPFPASCVIKNIQVISFEKTAFYRPKSALAYAATVSADKPVWSAHPAQFEIRTSGAGGIQSLQTFPVDMNIVGAAKIKYKLKLTSGTKISYYLRVRAINAGRYLEKMVPLDYEGEVTISNLYLRNLELVAKIDPPPAVSPIFTELKQFEIKYEAEGLKGSSEFIRPNYIGRSEIVYLAPHQSLYSPNLSWLRPAYGVEQVKPDLAAMHKLDATLSYAQILGGGKSAVLPTTVLAEGKHRLDYVSDKDVGVMIDSAFLQRNNEDQVRVNAKKEVGSTSGSKLIKLGLLILAGGILVLGGKSAPRWLPLVDRGLSFKFGFWGLQFMLFIAMLYFALLGTGKDRLSWGALLLIFSYCLAVRYRIRPSLVKRWEFFAEKHSAPYFLMFLLLLFSCAVMLMLKLNTAAENTAAMGYYLLVAGVIIEFIGFAKEARQRLRSTEKGEVFRVTKNLIKI